MSGGLCSVSGGAMKTLRYFLPALLIVTTPAHAVNDDQDWTAFGHVLTLIQNVVRIGTQPYPDQAMADLLGGRNHEANQAIASLFAGATAELPPEHRDRVASIGRDIVSYMAKNRRHQAHGYEARVEERGFLLSIEAGFRTGSDGEVAAALLDRLREAQLGGRRQQDLRARTPSVVARRDHGMHSRDLIAAALLAGGDRDLLPVRVPRRSALALGTRHRGGGEHRLDLRHAELDRFAHREVHALAGRDPLHQHYAKRRLALDGAVREHIDQHLQPLDRRDARAVLAAAAVEERDLIAGLYAQHVHRVVRAVFRQQHAATGAQGGVEMEARHARIFA